MHLGIYIVYINYDEGFQKLFSQFINKYLPVEQDNNWKKLVCFTKSIGESLKKENS